MVTRASHRQVKSARDPWKQSIETLNAAPGFAGTLLVSRDGLCVINACPRLRKPEVASAMAAAILAAAETLAFEYGLERRASFTLQVGRNTLLGVGASEELMIMSLLEPDADPEAARVLVEGTVANALRESPW